MGSQRARHNWATHTHTHMYLTISPVTREILYLFFKGFFFFLMWTILDYQICYNIASVLCFGFLASRHEGS